MRVNVRIILCNFAVLLLLIVGPVFAMPQDPQPAVPQAATGPDLIERLRLSPEQRQKIRAVREQTKDERTAINQQVRESNLALEQALDADSLDESLIEQRMRDVTTAQSAQMRMRIRTEVMIRRILNRDQIAIWRELRLQVKDVLGAQRPNADRPLRPNADRVRPNQRNGIFPRRNLITRPPRP